MRLFFVIAIIGTIVSGLFFMVGSYAIDHYTGAVPGDQRFVVASGENALELGGRLKESGIVFSQYAFLWHLSLEQKTHEIIAGEYELSGSMTIPEIALIVTSGTTVSRDIRVTFPEGFTMRQMAERLTKLGLPGDDFLVLTEKPLPEWRKKYVFLADMPAGATLEGFLFPDTYRFAPEATGTTIVTTLLDTFGRKYEGLAPRVKQSGKSFFSLLTMASIIEEEGRTADERAMISDVFWKRIAIGQALQSDATVNYVHGTTRLQPTFDDINADSPYNTYKYPGLPPGPISNPSLNSLEAAITPKSNPYYYFLVSFKTGETVYATTFEEHVRNRTLHGL